MRFFLVLLAFATVLFAQVPGESIPWKRDGFDPSVLMRGEMPDNFHMHHIMTFGASWNSWGYAHTGGSYTSVMLYEISPDLVLSAAVGISSTFWSKAPREYRDPFKDDVMQPELNIPFIALDWRAADNVNVHFEISDGSYCNGFFCDPYEPYSRPYRRPYAGYVGQRTAPRNAIFR